MHKNLLICLLLFLPVFCTAQKAPNGLYLELTQSKTDTGRILALHYLGEYYRLLPDKNKNNIDSAITYFEKGREMSHLLGYPIKEMHFLHELGSCFFDAGQPSIARKYMNQLIDLCRQQKNVRREALYQMDYGRLITGKTEKDLEEALGHLEIAYKLYELIKDRLHQLEVAQSIARVHQAQGRIDLAEQEYIQLLKNYDAIGYKKTNIVLYYLHDIGYNKGDIKQQLTYSLQIAHNIEAKIDTTDAPTYFNQLANIFVTLNQMDKAIEWAEKGLQAAKRSNNKGLFYNSLHMMVRALIQNRAQDALALIQKANKDFNPTDNAQKITLYHDMGAINLHLKRIDEAGTYFLKSDSVFNLMANKPNRRSTPANLNFAVEHHLFLSAYYFGVRSYDNGAIFLNKAWLVSRTPGVNPTTISILYHRQFQLDSATGDFKRALKNFKRYYVIRDSLFDITKSQQVADLNVKYETEKKEQAIKTFAAREKEADLQRDIEKAALQKMALQRDLKTEELKQVSLQRKIEEGKLQKLSLQRQGELKQTELQRHVQEARLQKANLEKNITYAGVVMLVLIVGLTYNGYRINKRSNRNLHLQQKKINKQNTELQTLLSDKDELLTEKDWLLKEVHHRVKNNLQVVMSLLSSQSAFLKNNTTALDAIRESQNRVQAISLIHQKLYNSNNVANISMPAYVADLVNYLAECFDIQNRRVTIEQLVEDFNLDLAQAVPIGLILNESITNAIKYAFDKKGGEIIVAIHHVGNDGLILHVSDNGKGLPLDFDLTSAGTLGMEMMKALSKQLGGEFKISNNSGVHISIEFLIEKMSNPIPGRQKVLHRPGKIG